MALEDIRGSMAKKIPSEKKDLEEIDIIIESEQWETTPSFRFTWRHALILMLILAGGILFAFGFLLIAGIILLTVIIMNVVAFIFRKLT